MKTKVVEYIARIKDAGAETLVKDYALLLDKSKFDVVVLCEDYQANSANYKLLKDNDIKIISTYGKYDYLCRGLSRIFGSKFRAFLLKKKIVLIKPDVIHIHLEQLEDIKNCENVIENTKLVYTCHNLPSRMIGEERPKEMDACKYLLEHNNLQIIALHEEMADEINKRFNIKNTKVIKNGINFNRFKNLTKTKEEVRKELGIPEDAYLIGHIGRFQYQKNHEFIIKVFNEVSKLNKNAYLLLVGDGSLKDEIIKKTNEFGLKDKVKIISNRNDIPELLNAMDVFFFPSRWEGFGIVMIESQIMNLPCVISDVIPKEVNQSNLIERIDLNDSLDKWANALLNPKPNLKDYGNLNDYDMNLEIKRLEKIYLAK